MVFQGLDERKIVEEAKGEKGKKEEIEEEEEEGIVRWTVVVFVAESLKGLFLSFVRVRECVESRRR